MILPILFLLIIFSYSIFITLTTKFKIESSIFISFSGIGLILYLFGLFGGLHLAFWLIILLSTLFLIYDLYMLFRRKIEIKKVITVGSILFILITLILFFITKDMHFTEWDEFSHWGFNIKSMLEYDLLWGDSKMELIHGNYPPFIGIIEYFICKLNGGFSEGLTIFSINIFMFSFILLLFKNFKRKDILKIFLFLLIIYRLIYINNFYLFTIYIDLIMGIILAVGALVIYKETNKFSMERIITILLIFIVLVLSKNIGIIFVAVLSLLIFVLDVLIPILVEKKISKTTRKSFFIILIICFITLLFHFSWSTYIKIYKPRSGMEIKESIPVAAKKFAKSLVLKESSDRKYNKITLTYYNALNERNISNENFFFKTFIQLTIFINLIGLIILHFHLKSKDERRKYLFYILVLNIGLIIFALFILFLYLFIFTDYEGGVLASFERYNGTYLVGFAIAIIGALIYNNDNEGKNSNSLLFAILLLLMMGVNVHTFVNPMLHHKFSPISEEIVEMSKTINKTTAKESKIYFVYQNSNGLEVHFMRYMTAPRKANFWGWSFGDQYYNGDIWTHNISATKFNEILCSNKYEYVAFINIDDQFLNSIGNMFNATTIEELNHKVLKITDKGSCNLDFSNN